MRGAAVGIQGVCKSYGDFQVLDNLSIDVAAAEVLVICGPSGCGKSTLLRCINGLESIQGGVITVDGVLVDRDNSDTLKKVRQNTGLVFQNFNLFPHMSVLDNITIAPVRVMGISQAAAVEEATALLESVGIPEKASAYPYQLSGGQRQRVAIARALAMKPSVMLFDEPTSALDPEMREEVLSVIHRVHAERNMTMIVVTHEIGFAKAVANRAILMEAGRIVEEAPAREFFDNPKSERARRFVLAIKND